MVAKLLINQLEQEIGTHGSKFQISKSSRAAVLVKVAIE